MENNIKILLGKYVSGKCSREELRQISLLFEKGVLSKNDVDRATLDHVDKIEKGQDYSGVQDKWNQFSEKLKKEPGSQVRKKSSSGILVVISSVAAVVLLLIVLGVGIFDFYQDKYYVDHLLGEKGEYNDTSTNLLTFDGQLIKSDLAESYLQVLTKDSTVVFAGKKAVFSPSGKNETGFNRLRVPYGKTARVLLGDSTLIFLNAGSAIVFPASFEKFPAREVFLTGEAYFDVKRDDSKPFVVTTRKMKFSVLGTTFNIHAPDDNSGVVSVLESGSLKVERRSFGFRQNVVLVPGQKSEYDQKSKSIRVSEVNTSEYTSWKDGFLLLNNQTLRVVTKKLSQYYNLNFLLSDQLALETLVSGKLLLLPDPEMAIKVLCDLSGLKYEVRGGDIFLNKVD